jgi:hypothetical protein
MKIKILEDVELDVATEETKDCPGHLQKECDSGSS